ncbi:MAG: MATE family efflux transporter [Firmicutes bacterium]|nr:MATE family efflux transporter [Bacillota bacterium]
MNEKTIEVFKNAPVPKAVMSNVIPSIISMLMVLVYNLADTFFIGQTKDAYMVASVSVATPAFLLFMAVGMLFGIGGTSLISRKLGEGDYKKAKQASSFCFWTGASIGMVAAVMMLLFATNIARVVGASEQTIGYASEYLRIVAVCIPFLIVSNAFSNIIRAEGSPKVAMSGMILGNMVNIVLDPIMILGFKWYVAGAAIATVFGNFCSAGFYIYHILKKSDLLSIKLKDYAPGNGIASGIFAIGIPASLNSILISTSNILINNMMAGYSDMAVAGLGVAMKVNMLVVMLLIGLGTGIQPLLGYCYGAKNRERYIAVLKFSTILAFSLSMVMTCICFFGAKFLVTAFLDNPNAFDYGFRFSRILIYSGPIMGIMFVFINAIQSLGAAFPALILNVSRQGLVYIPLLFVIKNLFDSPFALAATQPTADYIAATLAIILFIYSYKKYFGHE